MNTQKGIVFETTSSYSIFLTPDGQFQKGIPVPTSIEVGEEVQFRPYTEVKRRKRSFNHAFGGPIIAMAAAVVLFFSVLLPSQSTVSAFVQIDINPSIELGIDNEGTVQLFRGLNDDGMNLKRDIAFWKGKSLSWVLNEIVIRTESIIEETEAIEITTIYQKNVDQATLEQVIENAVTTSTSQIITKKQEVRVIEASVSDREAANEEGVSVQKYHAEIQLKKEEKQKGKKDKLKKQSESNQQDDNKTQTEPDSIHNDVKEQQKSKQGKEQSQKSKNEVKKQSGNKNEEPKNREEKDNQSSSNQKHSNNKKNNENAQNKDKGYTENIDSNNSNERDNESDKEKEHDRNKDRAQGKNGNIGKDRENNKENGIDD
jgi:hypothetical protein